MATNKITPPDGFVLDGANITPPDGFEIDTLENQKQRKVYLLQKYKYNNANTAPDPYYGLNPESATNRAELTHSTAVEYSMPKKRVEQDLLDIDDITIDQLLRKPAPDIDEVNPRDNSVIARKTRKRTLDETILYNASKLQDPRLKLQAKEYIKQREIERQKEEQKTANLFDFEGLAAYFAYFAGDEEDVEATMMGNYFRNKPDLVNEQNDTINFLAKNPNSSYVTSLWDMKINEPEIDKLSQMTAEERKAFFEAKGDFGFKETFERKSKLEYMLFSDAWKAMKSSELKGAVERIQDPEANYPKSKFTEHGYSPNYSKDLYIVRNHYFNLEEMQYRNPNGWAKFTDMGLNMAKYMGEIYLLSGLVGAATKAGVTGALTPAGVLKPTLIAKNLGQLSGATAMALANPGSIENLTIERMTDKGFIDDYGEFVKTEEGQSILMALPKAIAEKTVSFYIEDKGDDLVQGLFKFSSSALSKLPKGLGRNVDLIADYMKANKIKTFDKLPKSLQSRLTAVKNFYKSGLEVAAKSKIQSAPKEMFEEYVENVVMPILRLDDQYRDKDDSYLRNIAMGADPLKEDYLYQAALFSIIPFASGAIGNAPVLLNKDNFRAGPELPEVANRIQLENSLSNEYGLDRKQAVEIANLLDSGGNVTAAEEAIQKYEGFEDFSFGAENRRKALAAMLVDRGLASTEAIRIADIVSNIAKTEDARIEDVINTPEFKKEVENAELEEAPAEPPEPPAETPTEAPTEAPTEPPTRTPTEAPIDRTESFGEGEETKPRGLSKSIERVAIINDLVDQFDGIEGYQVAENKVEAGKVADIILKDPDAAIEMALTNEGIPSNVIPEMLYAAVANMAAKNGDAALLKKLALESVFVKIGTAMGQRIQALSTINKNSPFKAIHNIRKVREEQLKERGKQARAKAKRDAQKAQKKLDKIDEKLALQGVQDFIDEPPAPTAEGKVNVKSKSYGSRNKLVKKEEADAILAEIAQENKELRKEGKGKGRLGAAYVPTAKDFARAGKLGLYHLEALGRETAQWSKVMAEQLGDWVKPHLQQILSEAKAALTQQDREFSIEKLAKLIEAGKDIDKMGSYIQKLAKTYVADGVRDIERLLDAVTKDLIDLGLNPSRRDVISAVSGYGKTSALSEEEVDVAFRDAKGKLQQVGKLEDMQAGLAPSKTGQEHRTPSDEERQLIQQVNEAKKKGGFEVVDPKKQLKTALDGIKTRLKNAIKDLEQQIKTKTKIVKDKSATPSDAETAALRARKDELKKQFDEIFGKNKLTDQQKIDRTVKALERSIADYELKIKNRDISRKEAGQPVSSPEIEALKAKRDAVKAELDQLRNEIDPNYTYKKSLESQIKKLQETITNEDFAIKPKAERKMDKKTQGLIDKRTELKRIVTAARTILEDSDIVADEEVQALIDLSAEISRTKAIVDSAKEDLPPGHKDRMNYGMALVNFENYIEALQHQAQKKRLPERLKDYASLPGLLEALLDLAGTAKSIRASMDNSFIGRQGIKLFYMGITGDVKAGKIWLDTYWKSMSVMFNSLRGKRVMDVLRAEILSDPDYDLMRRAEVATATQEEEFPIHWPSQIPYFGRLFKASEDAFTASAYYMRFRLAQTYFKVARDTGVDLTNDVEVKSIGRLINVLTARGGSAKKEGRGSRIQNNIFWSPKMIMAQLETLTMPAYAFNNPKFSAFASKQAGWNLIRIITGQAMVLYLASLIWPESVEWNPTSSDFGKIKIGRTRYDISGGMSSLVVLASRVATLFTGDPRYKSTKGKTIHLNQSGWGKRTLEDVVVEALRNKTAPLTGTFLDILRGSNFDGDPTSIKSITESLFVPLPVENAFDVLNDMDDMTAAQVMANILLESQGISVQQYYNKKKSTW